MLGIKSVVPFNSSSITIASGDYKRMEKRYQSISSRSKLLQFSSRKNKLVQSTVTMNKWSLLLSSVLGILLSTTSELNFVDGRLGCCGRSSRPLLSDTRISIYEPHRAYDTFTEATQLISQKRDIRYDSRNVELKRTTRLDRRREQSEGKRISSDERFRVLRNVVFDLEDSTSSNDRFKRDLREINGLQLRRNLKPFSRDNFRENHVDRSRFRNDNFRGSQINRNSREREMNIEEELTEIGDNRYRHNDGSARGNLKNHRQERFNRRTFVIRTNIMPSENVVETRLERGNPDINTRQRLFRDIHLTSELSRNNDGRFRSVDGSIQFTSKIGILRNGNIRDNRRFSVRSDSIEKMYEKESLNAVRRNTNMEGTINVYRRSYDENRSEDILEERNKKNVIIRVKNERFTRLDKSLSRPKTIQSENEGLGSRISDDKRQINNGLEKRLFEKRYSTRRLPRQNSIGDKQYYRNLLIEATERASEPSRNRRIRENNREIIIEEYMAERNIPRNKNNLVEKREASSNINIRRNKPIRRGVLERLDRENSRYSSDHENENNFDQRRIRQITNRNNEDKLREASNTQRRAMRSTAIGQEINNIRQNYNEDNLSQRFLVRDSNNNKLVNRLEHERLSRTGKRASQITIIQRENRIKMHIRAINLQENRMQEYPNFNRLVLNTNRNLEKRQTGTYNDKEQLRNSLVREAERAFDERRIRQVRDKRDSGGEYRLNVERTVQRDLTHIGRNRDNVVESSLVSTVSSIGKNRLYVRIRSDAAVLRRRENYEARYSSAYENERIFDQRTTRNLLERREENIRNERNTARNSPPRNSMKNAMLNNNRRRYNDEINSQVMLARTNQRDMINRPERERSFSVDKRSSYLRMIQREHENRMQNEYRQPINIKENRLRRERCGMRCLAGQDFDINRIVEDRRTGTPKDKFNARDILVLETKPSDENRTRQQRNVRKYRLNEKLTSERVLVRNNNKIIEKRESRIRPEFNVKQNQKTRRSLILLQLREKDVPTLMRVNERDTEHDGRLRNRELSRIEDHSRNIRIAEERGFRNERSNTRDTRNKVITRYIETNVEFHDSDETRQERRTERIIRNIARHGVSMKNRHLLEAMSEKQRDVKRELDHISYERNYNGLEIKVHREKENVRQTSDRDNNRGRAARDIRASNDVQISKKESRITKNRRTSEEEREIRTGFSKLRYLPIEYKTQSDNQIFDIQLQYVFYILQGLYVLGLFTKTINSDGIQKSTRFSNWFPLFSTLKVY